MGTIAWPAASRWRRGVPAGLLLATASSRTRPSNQSPEPEPARPSTPPTVWPPKARLFGVDVSVTTYDDAVRTIIQAAIRRESAVVSCHAVHAVVTAASDPRLREQVNAFEMVTPDGQPVRWALNLLHGTGLSDRVYGPELMLRLCRMAALSGVPVYLYGGPPRVVQQLADKLRQRVPPLRIVGIESPPFRQLTMLEDRAVVDRINDSGARLVFIGLGCPKQDVFAADHRTQIRAVQVCVGAAFDIHAGARSMAPAWIQRLGLEWLFRLGQEPRRLWRRYLVTNGLFVWKLGAAWSRRVRRGRPRRAAAPRRAGQLGVVRKGMVR